MKPNEYIKRAIRTESKNYSSKSVNGITPRIEHAVFGLVTESGELMDVLKKTKFHDNKKDLDKVQLIGEAGDVMWYLALLCDELNVSFEDLWDKNIRKLQTRYPEKYSKEKSDNRDLDTERQVLEK